MVEAAAGLVTKRTFAQRGVSMDESRASLPGRVGVSLPETTLRVQALFSEFRRDKRTEVRVAKTVVAAVVAAEAANEDGEYDGEEGMRRISN